MRICPRRGRGVDPLAANVGLNFFLRRKPQKSVIKHSKKTFFSSMSLNLYPPDLFSANLTAMNCLAGHLIISICRLFLLFCRHQICCVNAGNMCWGKIITKISYAYVSCLSTLPEPKKGFFISNLRPQGVLVMGGI